MMDFWFVETDTARLGTLVRYQVSGRGTVTTYWDVTASRLLGHELIDLQMSDAGSLVGVSSTG